MTPHRAFEIVLELARDGILEDREADQDAEVLKPIQAEQQEAVNQIETLWQRLIKENTFAEAGEDTSS